MSAVPAPDLDAAARELCEQQQAEFLGPLGQGAFKSAYLARTGGGQYVALKLALISGPPDRLLRETDALRACEHQAISTLLNAFPFAYGRFTIWVVIEEFLPGGTLELRLKNGAMPPLEVRALGVRLADALAHLHPRRLVHRDIKPANIMFREDGSAVLTDFGIVRMLDAPSLTKAFLAQGPGTPAYAAPEQLLNEKALIDWRTDQFGLALVLVECLTGRHAYAAPGESIHDAIGAVGSRRALPVESTQALNTLGFGFLAQALEPWPNARFRRPPQFLEAFDQN